MLCFIIISVQVFVHRLLRSQDTRQTKLAEVIVRQLKCPAGIQHAERHAALLISSVVTTHSW